MIDYTRYDTLYGLDSKGKVRTWQMERSGNKYRTISGLEDGKKAESGWTVATPKNLGKTNATTPEDQAALEVQAEYTKKKDRKYYINRSDLQDVQAGGHKFFAPMLAEKYAGWDKLRHTGEWVFVQPKLDGIRAIGSADGFFSRQGKPFPAVAFLIDELQPLWEAFPGVRLDGELYNHDLRDNFDRIVSLVKKQTPTPSEQEEIRANVQYHVYDIAVSQMSCHQRLKFLAEITWLFPKCVKEVSSWPVSSAGELDILYGEMLADGYEGQMVRLPDSLYVNKRTHSLLKRKEFKDDEFPIVCIEEGEGNWAGYAKAVVCRLPDGREFGSGLKGNQEFARELLHRNPAPKCVTVRYQNMTPDGIPRFPVAVAFYDNERDT